MGKKSIFDIFLLLICISDTSLPVFADHFFHADKTKKTEKNPKLVISDCQVKSKGNQEQKKKKQKNYII